MVVDNAAPTIPHFDIKNNVKIIFIIAIEIITYAL